MNKLKINRETRRLRSALYNPFVAYLIVVGNIILIGTTVAFYYIEKGVNPHVTNYFDSFWWGVTTITTVGYGDIIPMTTGGRIVGTVLMYSGTVLFVSIIGVIVSIWMREEVEREVYPLKQDVEEVSQEIAPMERELEIQEAGQERIIRMLEKVDRRLEKLEKKDNA